MKWPSEKVMKEVMEKPSQWKPMILIDIIENNDNGINNDGRKLNQWNIDDNDMIMKQLWY